MTDHDPVSAGAALAALLARLRQTPSPFYRQQLQAAGEPGPDAAALLTRLPLTRRAELLRDQLDHLPHGTRRYADAGPPVRAGITGSGADLLVLTWTAADLARERSAGARLFGSLGVTAGQRVANTLAGALATPGALLLGDVIEDIGGLDVPLGNVESEAAARQAWELMDRVQPAVLVFDPPSAHRLFAATPPGARPWWRGIIWLRQGSEAAAPPVPASAGFAGWQRSWLAVPEAASFVAVSCAAARLHIDAAVLVEVVDGRSATRLPVGSVGELALTPLGGDAPLLRYASAIAARAVAPPCACGAPGAVVELTSWT